MYGFMNYGQMGGLPGQVPGTESLWPCIRQSDICIPDVLDRYGNGLDEEDDDFEPYSPYLNWLNSKLARYGLSFIPDWRDPRWFALGG